MSSYFREAVAQRGVDSPWEDLIFAAAAASGVPVELIKGVVSAESAWNPRAVSSTRSSYGLLQLNVVAQGITQAQAFDPSFAIPFGARVLAGQLRRLPSTELALAAYNAGTSRSAQDLENRIAGDVNGVGTYVQTVLDFAAWFRGNDPAIVGAPGVAPDGGLVAPPASGPTATASPWPFPAEISPDASADAWGPWLLVGLGVVAIGWWISRPKRGR